MEPENNVSENNDIESGSEESSEESEDDNSESDDSDDLVPFYWEKNIIYDSKEKIITF